MTFSFSSSTPSSSFGSSIPGFQGFGAVSPNCASLTHCRAQCHVLHISTVPCSAFMVHGQHQAVNNTDVCLQSSPSPFGASSTPALGPASSAGFSFGSSTPAFGASSGGFSFGGSAAPTFGASVGAFSFGGASSTAFGTPASSSAFSFGGASSTAFGAPASSSAFSFGEAACAECPALPGTVCCRKSESCAALPTRIANVYMMASASSVSRLSVQTEQHSCLPRAALAAVRHAVLCVMGLPVQRQQQSIQRRHITFHLAGRRWQACLAARLSVPLMQAGEGTFNQIRPAAAPPLQAGYLGRKARPEQPDSTCPPTSASPAAGSAPQSTGAGFNWGAPSSSAAPSPFGGQSTFGAQPAQGQLVPFGQQQQPQQQQQQQGPSLTTKAGQPITSATPWDDLSPDAQSVLKKIE